MQENFHFEDTVKLEVITKNIGKLRCQIVVMVRRSRMRQAPPAPGQTSGNTNGQKTYSRRINHSSYPNFQHILSES